MRQYTSKGFLPWSFLVSSLSLYSCLFLFLSSLFLYFFRSFFNVTYTLLSLSRNRQRYRQRAEDAEAAVATERTQREGLQRRLIKAEDERERLHDRIR